MSELLYKNITFEDAVELAKKHLTGMVETFIAAGYYIKVMKNEYEQHGYKTIWECAEAELGLKKTQASRAMSMNSKYSVEGNTPYIQEKYKKYGKSQLQEMLKMSEEQIEQISPDMTVDQIREIAQSIAEQSESRLQELEDFMQRYVSREYMRLKCIYDDRAEFLINDFSGCERIVMIPEANRDMVVEDDFCSFVDHETGEILEKYDPAWVVSILADAFVEKWAEKQEKMRPQLRGIMDHAYCMVCGCPLSEPDEPCPDLTCSKCGQAVDWDWFNKFLERVETEDIATSQQPVDTCPDEEIQTEIVVEIEDDTDQESLHVEFDAGELLQDLDSVIDADYIEVQELSSYGLPRTEYPEGSLIATGGCGHKYCCFSCALDCNIRQEDRMCVEATCGNPYSCKTMSVLGDIKTDGCQFLNTDLAYRTAGSGEPVPCCKKCVEINSCIYACDAAKKKSESQKIASDAPDEKELPVLKNNEQRKEWLGNFKKWGLWYRDEKIDVNYYKFDFQDGSRLVVAEYPQRQEYWKGEPEDEHFFHLLEKNKQGYKRTYDEQYRQRVDSEDYLVEFLKNMQKKGNAK